MSLPYAGQQDTEFQQRVLEGGHRGRGLSRLCPERLLHKRIICSLVGCHCKRRVRAAAHDSSPASCGGHVKCEMLQPWWQLRLGL